MLFLRLVIGVCLGNAIAAGLSTAEEWNSWTNDFATDLAPILALFGEQVTKQFLSESTSLLDCLIFALAPLGIVTAVVSAIRVSGSTPLKAFIGRAQEPHGAAEAELCSSTSEDVCELWSNGGICRVFGRPKILEFFYIKKDNEFYPTFEASTNRGLRITQPSCRIHDPKALLDTKDGRLKTGWSETSCSKQSSDCFLHAESQKRQSFAHQPNLTLNIGMRSGPKQRVFSWTAFAMGIALQVGFFAYATVATFYMPNLHADGKQSEVWYYAIALTGTLLVILGMASCARLIDRHSSERRFKGPYQESMMHWLQPGEQRVGDQLFNAFAYSRPQQEYVTSWKSLPDEESRHPLLLLLTAIFSSLAGFVCQFVGLRGLHPSITLYQVGATGIMAIIRATLHSRRRLSPSENELNDYNPSIGGHELDWQALNVERDSKLWCIVNPGVSFPATDSHVAHKSVEMLKQYNEFTGEIIGLRYRESDSSSPTETESIKDATCANEAIGLVRKGERELTDRPVSETHPPNRGARTLYYRTRLAYMTNDAIKRPERRWNTEVRQVASQLQYAIQESAEYMFSGQLKLPGKWHDCKAIIWSLTCGTPNALVSKADTYPIHFLLYRDRGSWKVDKNFIEAVLGLWWWSASTFRPAGDYSKLELRKKYFAITDPSRMVEYTSALRLWVSRTRTIKVESASVPMEHFESLSSSSSTAAEMVQNFCAREPTESLQEASGNKLFISIPAHSSPIKLVAQDIYSAFMCKMANLLEPMEEVRPRSQHPNTATSPLDDAVGLPYLGLVNSHVDILASKIVESGIASREEALMTIIAPLFQQSKLPSLAKIIEDLLSDARSLRRQGKFHACQDLLMDVLYHCEHQFQEQAVRHLGELYRKAARSASESDHDFGVDGLSNLRACCSFMRDIKEATQKTLQRYEALPDFYKDLATSGGTLILSDFIKYQKNNPHACGDLLFIDKIDYKKSPMEKTIRWAVSRDSPELIEDLWKFPTFIKYQDWNNRTPLFWVVEDQNCGTETLQALLECPGCKVDWRDKDGQTALLVAAEKGRHDMIRLLLSFGADVNASRMDGQTALLVAAEKGRHDMVRLLLSFGAEVNALRTDGITASWAAVLANHKNVLELLIEHQADINTRPKVGPHFNSTLLLHAIESEKYEIAIMLIVSGADLNAHDALENRPLFAALAEGKLDLVKMMLHEGVKLDVKDRHKRSPLLAAVHGKGDPVSAIRLLLDYGADHNAMDNEDETLLSLSVGKGDLGLTRDLLRLSTGPSPSKSAALQKAIQQSRRSITSAEVKIRSIKGKEQHNEEKLKKEEELRKEEENDVNLIKALLDSGADVNAESGKSGNNLLSAVKRNRFDIVRLLISRGAKVPYKDAMDVAATQGYMSVMEALLEYAVDEIPREESRDIRQNALYAAAQCGQTAIVALLLRQGADANIYDEDQGSALYLAAKNDHITTMKCLISHEAKIDQISGQYGTALQVGASEGHTGVVKYLISEGANVNLHSGICFTALTAACRSGRIETINTLIDAGADVNAVGGELGCPLIAATLRLTEHTEALSLLLRAGARTDAKPEVKGEKTAVLSAMLLALGDKSKVEKLLVDNGHAVDEDALNEASLTPARRTTKTPRTSQASRAASSRVVRFAEPEAKE